MGLIFMIINIGESPELDSDRNAGRTALLNTDQGKNIHGGQSLQLKLFGGVCQGEVQ